MAWLFRPGGSQVGAVRAPALAAGATALGGPGAIPALGIPIFTIFTVEAPPLSPGEGRAPAASGAPVIGNPVSSDRGRFCV
jgi:hypothetical protein